MACLCLKLRPQTLDSAELDFSRYGDVLFEVAFAGARLTTGGNVATEGKKLDFNVRPGLGCRVSGAAGVADGPAVGAHNGAHQGVQSGPLLFYPSAAAQAARPSWTLRHAPALPLGRLPASPVHPTLCGWDYVPVSVQILAGPADREAILPYIKWFQTMIRWVPAAVDGFVSSSFIPNFIPTSSPQTHPMHTRPCIRAGCQSPPKSCSCRP